MAEAIAALSLAANVLQMVEYGGTFVTTAWKMYLSQSESHLVDDFDQLRHLTQEVEQLLGSIEHNDPAASAITGLQDRDPDLLKLAAESHIVIKQILAFLNKIENPTLSRVKKAFKLTWNHSRLPELQAKLDRFRSQLTLHLVHSLRYVDNKFLMYPRDIHYLSHPKSCLGQHVFGKSIQWLRSSQTKLIRYHTQALVSPFPTHMKSFNIEKPRKRRRC